MPKKMVVRYAKMMQVWALQLLAFGCAGLAGPVTVRGGGDRVATARSGVRVELLERPGGRRVCGDGQEKSSQMGSARQGRRGEIITLKQPCLSGQAGQTNKHTSRSEVLAWQ
jgi:hypothetical protein